MALDIGQARVGIAISDPERRVATPLGVLPADEVIGCAPSFRRLLEDWEPELFVCGVPYTLAGEEGPQAQSVKQVAGRIASRAAVPCEFIDERLSSREAKRNLRKNGLTEREMRGRIDMIAASMFLQAWLDAQRSRPED
jgi:putative Holliday junction resolvase